MNSKVESIPICSSERHPLPVESVIECVHSEPDLPKEHISIMQTPEESLQRVCVEEPSKESDSNDHSDSLTDLPPVGNQNKRRSSCSSLVGTKCVAGLLVFARVLVAIACLGAVLIFVQETAIKTTLTSKPNCGKNQYLVQNANGSASCFGCPTCPPGQSLFPECGNAKPMSSSTLVDCVPCRLGVSFSRGHDKSPCTPCSFCAQDQVVEQNCSLQNNIKCAKQCHSKNRYYDDSKGACLHCSKCCGDDQDVVEDECREKLGAGSSMICSFHSSVNRCDRSKTTAHKSSSTVPNKSPANTPAATPDHTPTLTNTSARKDSKFDITTPSSLVGLFTSQRKDYNDSHVSVTIVTITIVVLVALIISVGTFVCFCKNKAMRRCIWGTRRDVDYNIGRASPNNTTYGNLDQVDLAITLALYKPGADVSNESHQPLIKKGLPENLAESQSSIKKESKLLSSLLQSGSYMYLKEICKRLDTPVAGVGNYREVLSYYDIDHYEMVSVYEKHSDGPTRALIELLAAKQEQLTVAEFVTVIRKEASRGDVIELLEKYDFV